MRGAVVADMEQRYLERLRAIDNRADDDLVVVAQREVGGFRGEVAQGVQVRLKLRQQVRLLDRGEGGKADLAGEREALSPGLLGDIAGGHERIQQVVAGA